MVQSYQEADRSPQGKCWAGITGARSPPGRRTSRSVAAASGRGRSPRPECPGSSWSRSSGWCRWSRGSTLMSPRPSPRRSGTFPLGPASGCCGRCARPRPGRGPPGPAARSCRTGRAGPSSARTSRRPGCPANAPTPRPCPSAAGFCSSALPSGIQSPCSFSIACRSSMQRNWYRSCVRAHLDHQRGRIAVLVPPGLEVGLAGRRAQDPRVGAGSGSGDVAGHRASPFGRVASQYLSQYMTSCVMYCGLLLSRARQPSCQPAGPAPGPGADEHPSARRRA